MRECVGGSVRPAAEGWQSNVIRHDLCGRRFGEGGFLGFGTEEQQTVRSTHSSLSSNPFESNARKKGRICLTLSCISAVVYYSNIVWLRSGACKPDWARRRHPPPPPIPLTLRKELRPAFIEKRVQGAHVRKRDAN